MCSIYKNKCSNYKIIVAVIKCVAIIIKGLNETTHGYTKKQIRKAKPAIVY